VAKEASSLASSVNAAAFNVGIALSAWFGGLAIDGGLGLIAPVWIGVALGLAALAVAAASGAAERRAEAAAPAGLAAASEARARSLR
jgi:MFS transporter, DHA1 family, inner membrane transport protein